MLGSVAMLLLAMLPISALGYDERCKWERYALSMPLQKKDLFFSKLLLGRIGNSIRSSNTDSRSSFNRKNGPAELHPSF